MGELIEFRAIEREEHRARAGRYQSQTQRSIQQNKRDTESEKREQNDRDLGGGKHAEAERAEERIRRGDAKQQIGVSKGSLRRVENSGVKQRRFAEY